MGRIVSLISGEAARWSARAVLPVLLVVAGGCDGIDDYLSYINHKLYPQPGLPQYQAPAVEALRKGISVNALGGNLMISRVDLSVDTLFGTQFVRRTFNSADFDWHYSFDLNFDGSRFVDDNGAVYDVTDVANDTLIPGTPWVKVDGYRLKSIGGLTHEFAPVSGQLERVYWGEDDRVRMEYEWGAYPGCATGLVVEQCTDAVGCADQVYSVCFDGTGGAPIEASDRAGTTVSYSYDLGGFLANVTKAGRARDRYRRMRGGVEAGGNPDTSDGMSIRNAEGETVVIAFENLGRWAGSPARRAESVTYAGTVTYDFEYSFDAGALLTSTAAVNESAGQAAAIAHVVDYVLGRRHTTTVRYPDGSSRLFSWKADSEGNRTDRRIRTVSGLGREESFKWSPDPRFRNELDTYTDAAGVETRWERDILSDGRVWLRESRGGQVQAVSQIEPLSRDIFDNRNPWRPLVRTLEDSEGNRLLANEWDWGEIGTSANPCRWGYGMTLSSTDAEGNLSRREYGLLSIDGQWNWSQQVATGMGLWEVDHPAGDNLAVLSLGWHGHPTERGWVYELFEPGRCRLHTHAGYTYDEVGNLLSNRAISPNWEQPEAGPDTGGVDFWVYDTDRNRTAIVLTNSACGDDTIDLQYRSDGGLVRVDRPCGSSVSMSYDALGQPVQQTNSDAGGNRRTTIGYDSLGRRVSVVQPNGASELTQYGSDGRPSLSVLTGSTGSGERTEVEYSWNNPLQLGSVSGTVQSPSGVRSYAEAYGYDSLGRQNLVIYDDGTTEKTVFDHRNRVQRLVYDGDRRFWLDYEYDGLNRQTELRLNGRPIVASTFSDTRIRSRTYANGLTRTFDYDEDWIQFPYTGGPARLPTFLVNEMVTTDADGAEVERTQGLFGTDRYMPFPGVYAVGLYMPCGGDSQRDPCEPLHEEADPDWLRLASARETEFGVEGQERRLWHYNGEYFEFDALSNTTAAGPKGARSITGGSGFSGAVREFSYSADLSRLNSVTVGGEETTYSYDHAGRVAARAGRELGYNGHGQLTRWGSDSDPKLRIEYDLLGRPENRIFIPDEGPWEVDRWCAGGTIKCDASGNWQSIDVGGAILDISAGSEHIVESDGYHIYRHKDWRGNILFLSDEDGDIITAYDYSAYGETFVTGRNVDREKRWVGGTHYDDLVVVGLRVYDIAANRFLSRDPVFNPINEYSYTLGNPVEFWDPSGAASIGTFTESIGIPSSSGGCKPVFCIYGQMPESIRSFMAMLSAQVDAAASASSALRLIDKLGAKVLQTGTVVKGTVTMDSAEIWDMAGDAITIVGTGMVLIGSTPVVIGVGGGLVMTGVAIQVGSLVVKAAQ